MYVLCKPHSSSDKQDYVEALQKLGVETKSDLAIPSHTQNLSCLCIPDGTYIGYWTDYSDSLHQLYWPHSRVYIIKGNLSTRRIQLSSATSISQTSKWLRQQSRLTSKLNNPLLLNENTHNIWKKKTLHPFCSNYFEWKPKFLLT